MLPRIGEIRLVRTVKPATTRAGLLRCELLVVRGWMVLVSQRVVDPSRRMWVFGNSRATRRARRLNLELNTRTRSWHRRSGSGRLIAWSSTVGRLRRQLIGSRSTPKPCGSGVTGSLLGEAGLLDRSSRPNRSPNRHRCGCGCGCGCVSRTSSYPRNAGRGRSTLPMRSDSPSTRQPLVHDDLAEPQSDALGERVILNRVRVDSVGGHGPGRSGAVDVVRSLHDPRVERRYMRTQKERFG